MSGGKTSRIMMKYISLFLICVILVGIYPRVNSSASVSVVNYYPYRAVGIMDAGGRLKARFALKNEIQNKSEESYLLAEISKPEILAEMNSLNQANPEELTVILVALCVLRHSQPDEEIILTKDAADAIYRDGIIVTGSSGVPYKLEEGTSLSVEVLLNAYLLSGSESVADLLLTHIYPNEGIFSRDVKYITKKLKTINTRYNEHTTAYDLYLLVNELLRYNIFVNCMGADYIEFLYQTPDGNEIMLKCNRSDTDISYSDIIPADYSLMGRIDNSILILSDSEGRYYLGILTNGDMSKLLAALPVDVENSGVAAGEPIPEEAILPTESDEARYEYIFGTGTPVEYYTIDNKPKNYETAAKAKRNMKTITVPVWKINSSGEKYASKYSLTIHKSLVESVKCIFNEIFDLNIRFPIKYMIGYSYRKVGGVGLKNSRLMSVHSFGAAIDINPGDYDNDYYLGHGNDLRDTDNPYYIPKEVITVFEKYGWFWGGDFKICADTMHFQYLGLDFLDYVEDDQFPVLQLTFPQIKNQTVDNLQQRLAELGYLKDKDRTGQFGIITRDALIKFQGEHGLEQNGITDYKTWETIINLTHYLQYEF